MGYQLDTEMDGDFFHVRIEPDGATDLGELAGRLEQYGLPGSDGEINGYDAEAQLTDDAIKVTLDTTTGDDSPQALVEATEEIRGYVEQYELPDEFVDQFSGGMRTEETFPYK